LREKIRREGEKRIWREREKEEKWYCGGKNVSVGLKKKARCYNQNN